jgi:indole-3-glycerol phosphate synthase
MTILEQILQTKRAEVAAAKRRRPFAELRPQIHGQAPARDFYNAVTAQSPHGIQLIPEVKKASPSAGLIVQDFDPVRIARTYAEHGATAISVLTDETYFQGRISYIRDIREVVDVPVLRKDFIVDEYQVYESRAAGADAILLIATALDAETMQRLHATARSLNMSVLVEVHTESDLQSIIATLGPPTNAHYLLGINNRDLHAQRTDLAITERLAHLLPPGTPFVSESGVATREDVLRVQKAGACALLVGESLLRADDIGAKTAVLLGREP